MTVAVRDAAALAPFAGLLADEVNVRTVDVTELADYLGAKYGGWYDVCKRYCTSDGRWIALLIEREDQSSQLAVVNARSGELRVLKSIDWRGVNKAVFSPDGRYLAYDLGPKKIRVNCISAGPVNTLAARGISGFMSMLKHYQERAPLRRSCDPAELGATGVFLASDAAAAITGQVIYVDGGYQIMGL